MNIKDSIDNTDWQIVESMKDGKQGSKTFSEVWQQIVPAGTMVFWNGKRKDVPDGWIIYDESKINESLPSCYYIIKFPFQFLFGKITKNFKPIEISNAKKVKEINVYTGYLIDSIVIIYNDGNQETYGGGITPNKCKIEINDKCEFKLSNLRHRKEDGIPIGFDTCANDKSTTICAGDEHASYTPLVLQNGLIVKLAGVYSGVSFGGNPNYPAIAGILFDVLAIPKK